MQGIKQTARQRQKSAIRLEVKKFGFSSSQRLRLKNDFKSVFNEGRKFTADALVMWYKPSKSEYNRLAIMVAKKLGKAVLRNRIKRVIREVFRLNEHKITAKTDIILYPRVSERFTDFANAQSYILSVWKKAGVTKND
jgi:ribonuclease P protein component